jgi:hypothetical protein
MQPSVDRRLSSKGHLVPKELLDQVHVGHDHTPAAVTAATKLVHGITERDIRERNNSGFRNIMKRHLPISHTLVEELEIALPKVTHDLDGYQQRAN